MVDDKDLDLLRTLSGPAPRAEARARARAAALAAYDGKNHAAEAKGTAGGLRLTERMGKLWRETMHMKLMAAPALAGLVALPIAGYATFSLLQTIPAVVAGRGAY